MQPTVKDRARARDAATTRRARTARTRQRKRPIVKGDPPEGLTRRLLDIRRRLVEGTYAPDWRVVAERFLLREIFDRDLNGSDRRRR